MRVAAGRDTWSQACRECILGCSSKALRVLVVDDDEFVRDLLVEFMCSLGHEPRIAANGREGVLRFDLDRPDVVITDLVMPGVTGWDVVMHVRRMAPRTPIIIVSGGATRADVERARLESVSLLHKPILLAELSAVLERVGTS